MNCTIEELKKWLQANLDEERYLHTIGVAECAEKLAEECCLDKDKAYLTGLLHDCAKCISKDDLKVMLNDCSDLCNGELLNSKTLHAPAGAILAKQEFGIDDDEILSAIRWHTLGKKNMSLFEKIIFLADKIETKTRPDEWAKPIRDALSSENGLNKAILVCYKNTIKSLIDRDLMICQTTIDIYNDLLKNM